MRTAGVSKSLTGSDQVTIEPSGSGFDPATDKSDQRLCSILPEYAPYEELCDTPSPGVYESCNPQRIHDLMLPDDTECSYNIGLTLAGLEFSEGHSELPEGGLVIVGFDFHRTTDHNRKPRFFIPSFQANDLEGASLVISQSYLRNAKSIPDGRCQSIPGQLAVTSALGSIPETLTMPDFLPMPAQSSVPDAGLEVTVVFIPEDPSVWPNPVLERTYSVAEKMSDQLSSANELPETLLLSISPESELTGLVLSKVDRAYLDIDDSRWDWDQPLVITDPLWRIYAPAGTTSIHLQPEFSPFSSADEVWVMPSASSFATPFEYDLLLDDQIIWQQTSYSQDSYATIVP